MFVETISSGDQPDERALKRCPRCAEDVRAEAKMCRYCRFEFVESTSADTTTSEPHSLHLRPQTDPSMSAVQSQALTAAVEPAAPQAATDDVACPRGGHPQFVQRLAAMAATGNAPAYAAKPVEPTYSQPWGLGSIGWVAFWVIGVLLRMSNENPYQMSQNYSPASLLFYLAILVGPVIWWKETERRRRRTAFMRAHPLWQAAMKRWNLVYWCSKCGIEFVPGEDVYTEIGLA